MLPTPETKPTRSSITGKKEKPIELSFDPAEPSAENYAPVEILSPPSDSESEPEIYIPLEYPSDLEEDDVGGMEDEPVGDEVSEIESEEEFDREVTEKINNIDVPEGDWNPETAEKMETFMDNLIELTEDPEDLDSNSNGENEGDENDETEDISAPESSTSPPKKRNIEEVEQAEGEGIETEKPSAQRPPKKRKTKPLPILPSPPASSPIPPTQILYKPHALHDHPDSYYREHFRRLYHQLASLCKKHFSTPSELSPGSFHQPWSLPFSKTFITIAKNVIEKDEEEGEEAWNVFLVDSEHRVWFVMGFIWKILAKHVFEKLLFGATEQQERLLLQIDLSMLGSEGYRRTALRSTTTRTFLSTSHPIPPLFHLKTTTLTHQIITLLAPLKIWLLALHPDPSTLPTETQYTQELHNLIFTAGYLHLTMRLSPTIFNFVETHPGSEFEKKWAIPVSEQIHDNSRAPIWTTYLIAFEKWRTEYMEVKQELETILGGPPREPETEEEKEMVRRFEEIRNQEPGDPGKNYNHRLKIAVWPLIYRYKVGEDKDDVEMETGGGGCPVRRLEGKNGFRQVLLGKGVGVYYYGRRGRGEDYVGLGTWQKRKEREFGVVEKVEEKKGWLAGCGIQ